MSTRLQTNGRVWPALVLGAVVAAMFVGSATASARQPIQGSFGGESYGTYANPRAGRISSQLGRSAYLPCPCIGTNNQVRVLTGEAIRAGGVFSADAIRNTVQAGKAPSGLMADLHHTSKVSAVSALDGLIAADEILAAANTHADRTSIESDSSGSHFRDLRIGGTSFSDNVAPNTTVPLAGFGHATLRETQRLGDGEFAGGIAVNMIHIFVTQANTLDIPIGSEIIVAHARTRFTRATPSVAVGGSAWAADASSRTPAVENRIGKVAPIYMGCQGTHGAVLTNNLNRTNVPGILRAGTAVSRTYGTSASTLAVARTSARIDDVDLMDGVLTADSIKAVSQSRFSTSTGGATSGETTFADLRISNVPQAVPVPPNTRVTLPGVGYVVLNEQVGTVDASGARLKVTAIRLVVTDSGNPAGVPVGTVIRIAIARTTAFAL